MSDQAKPLHVALIPSPGMGHLIPLVELAKRLVSAHNMTATFIVPTNGPPAKAMLAVLSALPPSISHVILPPVTFDDLPEHPKIETLITLTLARSLPALRTELGVLQARRVGLAAVVADLFASDAFDVASELGVMSYLFFPSTGMLLSLLLQLPEMDRTVLGEYRDLPLVELPGCVPFPGSDILDPLQDRTNDAYRSFLYHAKRYRLADGIMINSFPALEPGALALLTKPEEGKPAVHPVGPLVNVETSAKADDSNCLTWLDSQPAGSVLFVSFGSGGTLSSAQIRELAFGLEKSEQRFLWVVRPPNDAEANATYFNSHAQNDASFGFLPEGFLERTKEVGLVVSSWAPQAQILAHVATGGFLTHCGWNSTLESVVNGVPLIAWPLYAEQKMNAFSLENDVRVALRVKHSNDTGLVENDEVSRLVKALFEGEEGKKVRSRMRDLKEASSKALTHDGASTQALSSVVRQWRNHITQKI